MFVGRTEFEDLKHRVNMLQEDFKFYLQLRTVKNSTRVANNSKASSKVGGKTRKNRK